MRIPVLVIFILSSLFLASCSTSTSSADSFEDSQADASESEVAAEIPDAVAPFIGKWEQIEGSTMPDGSTRKEILSVFLSEYGDLTVTFTDNGQEVVLEYSDSNDALIGSYYGRDNVVIKVASESLSLTIDPFGEFQAVIDEKYDRLGSE